MADPDCFFFGGEEITAANLLVGPPDAENQVYNAADAPYALDDEVWRNGHAFRSLIDNNSDDTSVAASWKDLGQVDNGALAHVAQSYNEGDYVVLNGRVYRSPADGNLTTPGASDSTWADVGPTNRFKAFNLKSNVASEGIGTITWVFNPTFSMNAMLLILPRGAFATIMVTDVLQTELYNEEFRLTQDSGGGPYNHDFSPIERATRVIVHGLPPGSGNTITVKIRGGEDAIVGVGQIGLGFAHDLGVTVLGSRVTLASFRDPDEDEFGNVTFPNRPIRRNVRFQISNDIAQNERVLQRVGPYINQPAGMYLTDGEKYGLCAYGFVRNVNLSIDSPGPGNNVIEVRGFAE